MGAKRDFTDAAKAKLEAAVKTAAQQNQGFEEFKGFQDYSNQWNVKPGIGGSQVPELYGALNLKLLMTAEQVEKIFESVYGIERDFSGKLRFSLSRLERVNQILAHLSAALNPAGGGPLPISLPQVKFAQRLKPVGDSAIQLAYEQMVESAADGTVKYKWDEIERILSLPAGDITDAQYCMLAQLYTGQLAQNGQLSLSDKERFLNALADRIPEDQIYIWPSRSDKGEYPQWSYDFEKLGRIEHYVNQITGTVTAQWEAIGSLDEDKPEDAKQIRELYTNYFGGSQSSVKDMAASLRLKFQGLRNGCLVDSAVLNYVGQVPWKTKNDDDGSYSAIQTGPFVGEKNARGPIRLMKNDPEGYILSYTGLNTITGSGAYGFPEINTYLLPHTIEISEAQSGSNVNARLSNSVRSFHSGQESSEVIDTMLSTAFSEGIGYVPYAGPALSLAFSVGGAVGAVQKSQRDSKDREAVYHAWDTGTYCGQLDLAAVYVGEKGQAGWDFYLAPNPKTTEILARINTMTVNMDFLHSREGYKGGTLHHPITISDVLNKGESVYSLLNSLDPNAREYIANG